MHPSPRFGENMEQMDARNEELWKFPEKPLINNKGSTSKLRCTSCEFPVRQVKKLMSSGLLIKGFALSFGLWNPRRQWRAVFSLIFFLVDVYNSIQAVTFAFVCPTLRTVLDSWFCANISQNFTSTSVEGILLPFHVREAYLLDFMLKTAQLLSHLTFFWSVWMLTKKNSRVGQEDTLKLVKPTQWAHLNSVLLFFWFTLVSSVVWVLVQNWTSRLSFLVASGIYPISLWTSLMTCWLFGTVTMALETLTTRCLNDIMASEHLDDVIRQHQQLCKIIFSTSNAFKLWFIVNWILYTLTCVFWAANFVFYFDLIFQSWCIFYYNIISLGIYIYVFIYPCYRAAALTEKCQQMLAKFNMMDKEDWHRTHPFCKRSELHLFLQYANYADCGYRVGRLTFGSMSIFFSTLLAMLGIGLKIF